MAQMVGSGEDSGTLVYEFMKDVFTKRNDTKRLKKLEQMVDRKENGKVAASCGVSHSAQYAHFKDKEELL